MNGAGKAKSQQIEPIDKGIDHAHRILFADIVVEPFWQQGALSAECFLDEAFHRYSPDVAVRYH